MRGTTTVPMLSPDRGLTHYLTEIRQFPMLRPGQEMAYATRWREHGDREAAYHLVTSHLRLVAKIAMRYRSEPSCFWLLTDRTLLPVNRQSSENPMSGTGLHGRERVSC